MKRKNTITLGAILVVGTLVVSMQGLMAQQDSTQYHRIDGAVIYDHDPSTQLGDDIFGDIIADFENDAPGRCSHGGPVCLEYPNGNIAAFHSNTSDHNLDGWSEYALSRDGGRTWKRHNKVQYSFDAYAKDQKYPVWVEEGLVTERGTIILFLTHFRGVGGGIRIRLGTIKSYDNGATWTVYETLDDGAFTGYPCSTAVVGETNYVLVDSNVGEVQDAGPHVLYVSRDDGRSWSKRSALSLDHDKWYGTMTIMADGRLLAGAYTEKDEQHFYYCISKDEGHTWGPQQKAYVDKMIRDPELAYLSGKYYLQGRSGHGKDGGYRFVLYQSDDGERWGKGIIVSGDRGHPDGYSQNCIINKYDDDVPNELMAVYAIVYERYDTNEYVYFIRPDGN